MLFAFFSDIPASESLWVRRMRKCLYPAEYSLDPLGVPRTCAFCGRIAAVAPSWGDKDPGNENEPHTDSKLLVLGPSCQRLLGKSARAPPCNGPFALFFDEARLHFALEDAKSELIDIS